MEINELRNELVQVRTREGLLLNQIAEIETGLRKQVAIKKNEKSTVLSFNGRRLVVTRNRYNRLSVKEGSQIVNSDYLWGLQSLRLDIAEGKI
jgi:hypothetical protein